MTKFLDKLNITLALLLLTSTPVLVFSQEATPVEEVDGLFYTVQIGTFSSPETPESIVELSDVYFEKIDDIRYRYLVGVFREMEFARTKQEELINQGFKGAFVIAYENGDRISLRVLRERMVQKDESLQDTKLPVFKESPDKGENESNTKFNFEITNGNVLSEATREVSDLFENQILDYREIRPDIEPFTAEDLFTIQFDTISQVELDSALLREEIERLRNDWGLDFNTWYIYNFEPGLGTVEDVFYRQRANFTLEMNLLRGGLYTNRNKAKQLEREIELMDLRHKEESERDRYEDLYNYTIYLFNLEKLNFIDERVKLLNRKKQILEMLYTSKDKTWEDVLELRGQITRAENMYNKWQQYNTILRDKVMEEFPLERGLSASKLPVLQLNPDSLFSQSQNANTDTLREQMQRLRREIIEIDQNRWKDVGLRPFLRYTLIGDNGNAVDRTFSSGGISLDIPINWKGRNSLTEAQIDAITHQDYKKEKNDNHELLNYYYEYEYKLEQLITLQYNYGKIEERLRKQIILYQFKDPKFSPLLAVQYLDEMLSTRIEMIDTKQMLYLKIIKMMEYMQSYSPLQFSDVLDLNEKTRKYKNKRDIYCWSDFFYNQNNLFLIHYLKVNEVRNFILSVGTEINRNKVEDFVQLANRYDVNMHGMIGNNGLALDVQPDAILEYVERFHQMGFKGIHFDIEPQTFPDWDGNKKMYLSNLKETFRIARKLCNDRGMKLSASIPTYYPKEQLPEIYSLLDKVYLMAYERPDIEFIARKTSEEFALNKEKTVLSLRTKDFNNRLVMEKFIEALDAEIQFEEMAIHDLGTLFEMDYATSFEE
jgi:hypothetical protein